MHGSQTLVKTKLEKEEVVYTGIKNCFNIRLE